MAFIKCPECGKRFSNIEHTCPYCGCLWENRQPSQPESQSNDHPQKDYKSKSEPQKEQTNHQSQQNSQQQSNCVNVKCNDCGQEYYGKLEACPNCGCPTKQQSIQVEHTAKEEVSSQDKTHPKRKGANWMKAAFIILPIIIIAGILAAGIIYHHRHTYEYKMAQFEKVANEFKTTLTPDNRILAEIIDSVAQKVFYTIEKDPEFDIDKDVMVHDYETGETKSVLPASHKIEDYVFSYIGVKAAKMIEDRLFLIISSGSMGLEGIKGVFYVNIRDNSLHYVESCNDAEFEGSNSLHIKKMYRLGMQDEWTAKFETIYYSLSTLLSDEAYATNRWEQKRKEERLAEEWRKRDIERTIEFDYTIQPWPQKTIDHISTLGNYTRGINRVISKIITIPKGKVWVFKRFSVSGYCEFPAPELFYHKITNGSYDAYGEKIKNGDIFYSGQYLFSIFDLDYDKPGHRIAKIEFTEELY